MNDQSSFMSIDGSHHSAFSTDALAFYEKYWLSGTQVSAQSQKRYKFIVNALFPEGLRNKRILELGVGGEGGIIHHLKP